MIPTPVLACWCFFLCLVFGTSDVEDFVKVAFPQPLVEPEDGKPVGNNLPFGMQRPADGPVKEYSSPLNANDFWRLHVKDHIPLVYRGIIKDSPAILNWNDQYLAENYGELDVLVEHKTEDRTSTSGRMRIKNFLKFYKSDDLYVVSMLPKEMMHEVRAVASVMCGTFKNYTHESNLWISNGGTRSVIHYDADHNIHCMLAGRKDFMMIPNNVTTKRNLYFKRKMPTVGSGFTYLNPDSINMEKFPNVAKVPWTWATLFSGDCIYIPSVYIHQVRSYGRSIGVTTLFTADIRNEFNGDDCTDEIMRRPWTMADINFHWYYEKGSKTIDMGYMNVALVRENLLSDLQALTQANPLVKGMSLETFLLCAARESAAGRNIAKMSAIWIDVFKFAKDQLVSADDINRLSLEQMKSYARAVEDPHGVVTDGHEEVFIRPGGGERMRYEKRHQDLNEETSRYLTDEERVIMELGDQDPESMYAATSDNEDDDPEDLEQLHMIARQILQKRKGAGNIGGRFEAGDDADELAEVGDDGAESDVVDNRSKPPEGASFSAELKDEL